MDKGRPQTPGLLRLAGPIILANLTTPLLGLVDTAVAGHLGTGAALGGVALGGVVFSFLTWGFGFLRMGTTGLAAQATGAGDRQALGLVLGRGLIAALILGGLIVMLKTPLTTLALAALGGSPDSVAAARLYIGIRLWAAPASLVNLVILGWLLGRQQVGRGLALQALINGLNAALAVGLVYGAGAGLGGIAGATALADGLGAGAGLLLTGRQLGWRFGTVAALANRIALLRLATVNRDIFLRTLLLLTAFALFARLGAGMGDTVLAANALLMTFQTLMAYGLDGFANAAEALVGAAIGAGDRVALRAAIRVALLWAGAAAIGFSLVFLAIGPRLVLSLTDLPPIRTEALRFLPWAVLSPLVSVWSFQLDGIFIGAVRTSALRNGMAVSLAGFMAAALVLPPHFGNHGLWGALMIFMAMRAATLALQLPGLFRHADSRALSA